MPHSLSIAFVVLVYSLKFQFFFFSFEGHACMNADQFLSSKAIGSVERRPRCLAPLPLVPATAGCGFYGPTVGVLEGIGCECWGGGAPR